MKKQKCDHKWVSCGLWDGVTSDGRPTGGLVYRCQKCKEMAQSGTDIEEKGGEILNLKGFDVYGRPQKEIKVK